LNDDSLVFRKQGQKEALVIDRPSGTLSKTSNPTLTRESQPCHGIFGILPLYAGNLPSLHEAHPNSLILKHSKIQETM
jgi:hypothetical protein